ncbi:sentrin-specific protease 7-like [Drosophila obscura]|uniref:sentrin-specific protease 7-like n=1 Tax=Drosophila obscura TaxID=7282 RepID=UPI001BB26F2A|nr:sentrin-specific protease 7-like [Drosophila obscura]
MKDEDFVRGDVMDLKDVMDDAKFCTRLDCRCVRLIPYRFDQIEPITFTSKGIRIDGLVPKFTLNIYKHEVINVMANFGGTDQPQALLALNLRQTCEEYVMTQLGLPKDQQTGVHPQTRRLVLQFAGSITLTAREHIKTLFSRLDEISAEAAAEIFRRIVNYDSKAWDKAIQPMPRQLHASEQEDLLIYPPSGTSRILIHMSDFVCLTNGHYINDIIIDFYLLWLNKTQIPVDVRERTHIFNSFFYKRLTTLMGPVNSRLTAAQKRHAGVQKWTKAVDIFDKDFIIVPIHEQMHWLVAIICFPNLRGPVTCDTDQPQIGSGDGPKQLPAMKQPLILLFDSLGGDLHRNIMSTLRNYLTCEYKKKKPYAQARIFDEDNMPGYFVRVPLMPPKDTNDGLFLLQYVEQFFAVPIEDYRLPIEDLTNWFDLLTVNKKREDIANLIQQLMDEEASTQQCQRLILPVIELPTLNGQLVSSNTTNAADIVERRDTSSSSKIPKIEG